MVGALSFFSVCWLSGIGTFALFQVDFELREGSIVVDGGAALGDDGEVDKVEVVSAVVCA